MSCYLHPVMHRRVGKKRPFFLNLLCQRQIIVNKGNFIGDVEGKLRLRFQTVAAEGAQV